MGQDIRRRPKQQQRGPKLVDDVAKLLTEALTTFRLMTGINI